MRRLARVKVCAPVENGCDAVAERYAMHMSWGIRPSLAAALIGTLLCGCGRADNGAAAAQAVASQGEDHGATGVNGPEDARFDGGDGPVDAPRPDPEENPMPSGESFGECVPEEDDACVLDLTPWTEPLGSADLVGAVCRHEGSSNYYLPMCHCTLRVTPADAEDSAREIVLRPGDRFYSCSEYSRTPGCLYCGTEFPGCSVDDDGSCDAVCIDMASRYSNDLQKTFAAVPRLSRCTENFICEHVTELDGKCYARRPVSAELPSFDCALSDEEILTHQNEDYASYCTERPSVTCTTARDCPRGLACSDEGICVGCGPSCYDDDGRPVVCIDQPRCAEGEFCIASVCLPGANIDCIGFTQCSEGEDCVLSGIDAAGGRGNANTRSLCVPNPI
jgi:hypothetical protein